MDDYPITIGGVLVAGDRRPDRGQPGPGEPVAQLLAQRLDDGVMNAGSKRSAVTVSSATRTAGIRLT